MDGLTASYHVHARKSDIEERATQMAYEQTVELPLQQTLPDFSIRNVVPDVASIESIGSDTYEVKLAFPAGAISPNLAQIINLIFGNVSLQPDVELIDCSFPEPLQKKLGGPSFGIDGLRRHLGIWNRPLTCTALKPLGSSPVELAGQCRTFARAGINLIKDDHGLANHSHCRFRARVRACQKAVDEVNQSQSRQVGYVPNIMASPATARRQLEYAQKAEVAAVMVAPMLLGLPTTHELIREHAHVPVLAHPSFGGSCRVAPPLLYGTLFRYVGADAVIFPHHEGRFRFSREVCQAVSDRLRQSSNEIARAFPVPAGGIQLSTVESVIQEYGRDTILLIGGSLRDGSDSLEERSRAFVRLTQESASRSNG